VTVTDSRGRTATNNYTIAVVAYAQPSISLFKAERCNAAGTAPQADGNRVRVSVTASASSVNSKNTMACTVFYKLKTASAWTQSTTITPSSYAVNTSNLLLAQTFDPLLSYDIMVRVVDWFQTIEQSMGVGTKQVMIDLYRDGNGIAFGKISEAANIIAMGWPVSFDAGMAPVLIPASANLNSYTQSGMYYCPANATVITLSNRPTDLAFALWVGRHAGTNQMLFEYQTGAPRIWIRNYYNGAWGAWYEVYTTYKKPTYGELGTVPLGNGGTGQTTAAGVRNTLGLGNTTGAVPVANGGTGAAGAKAAMNNLGIFYAATLPTTANDGQVCLVPV